MDKTCLTSFFYLQIIIEIQLDSEDVWRRHGFVYVYTVTVNLEVWPWINFMTHPWVMENNCEKYNPDQKWQWGVIARTRMLDMCTLWPWPRWYDLRSRSWHTLWVMDNDRVIFRSSMAMWSYGPDTDFGYMCTMTLTLEIWPWVKVMTFPLVMNNNCVQYYSDRTRGNRTRCEQTDRQGDFYIPTHFVCEAYKIHVGAQAELEMCP